MGLRGLVIKSHGGADAYSFEWAIQRAYDAAKNGVLNRIANAMEQLVKAQDDEKGLLSEGAHLGDKDSSNS